MGRIFKKKNTYADLYVYAAVMSHRVVKGHTVDGHEVLQVVFVRRVVPVPGHHVERGEILCIGGGGGGAQNDNK